MVERAKMRDSEAGYAGVIATSEAEGLRFIVTPRGAAYAMQKAVPGGEWVTIRELPEARFFSNWCFANDFEPDAEFAAAVEAQPDNPRECALVPYAGGRRPARRRRPASAAKGGANGGD